MYYLLLTTCDCYCAGDAGSVSTSVSAVSLSSVDHGKQSKCSACDHGKQSMCSAREVQLHVDTDVACVVVLDTFSIFVDIIKIIRLIFGS